MYVIIVFDPATSEFKETIGPFYSRMWAYDFADKHALDHFMIAKMIAPREYEG